MVTIDGFAEVDKVLRSMPDNIGKKAKVAAGRKAAKPIVQKARNLVQSTPTKTKGNLDGFEHLRAIQKLIKSVVYKGTVNVQIDPRSPDLPMGDRNWNAYSVARLFAFGRQNPKGTGIWDGFGDWIHKAGQETRLLAGKIFKDNLENEVQKAISRTMRRYGKQN